MFKRKDKSTLRLRSGLMVSKVEPSKTLEKVKEKILDIEAKMEGNLKFNTPTNLRINGSFVGELETKGTLTIGERADVRAKIIKGENIIILGKVNGNIKSSKRLELSPPAEVIGDIKTPILVIKEGASLKGHCQMPIEEEKGEPKESPKKKK